jgi:hypothetical protein
MVFKGISSQSIDAQVENQGEMVAQIFAKSPGGGGFMLFAQNLRVHYSGLYCIFIDKFSKICIHGGGVHS